MSPSEKQYICFQIEGESDHAVQCAISVSLIKVMKAIFETDSFEEQCVIIKGFVHY